MKRSIFESRMTRAGLALATLVIAAAMAPGIGTSSGDVARKVRSCKNVVVQFEPEGSGGATKIRVKRIKCKPARKIIRRCINGELKSGWSGSYSNNRFHLRRKKKRINYLPVGGGGCIPVRGPAAGPAPPSGADRIETYKPRLNGDSARDRVYVYDLPASGSPSTHFDSWVKASGGWKLEQRKLVNEIPSMNPDAGLEESWLADLNRDGRKELAIRDFFSPSYGESLSIFTQRSKRAAKFERLQNIGGDRVVVKPKGGGKPAVISVYRRDIHSPDNAEHHEKWKWVAKKRSWRCKVDCAPIH